MTYRTLYFTCQDYVGSPKLNRQDRLNAISIEMVKEQRHLFTTLDERPEVSVVIITGTGQAFCAGSGVRDLTGLIGKGLEETNGLSGLPTNGHTLQHTRP